MNSVFTSVAYVYSNDANYYYYKRSQPYTVYYGNSQSIYLVDTLFKPVMPRLSLAKPIDAQLSSQLDSTYLQFRKLNIPALNQFRFLQKMKLSTKNLTQISLTDIMEAKYVYTRSIAVDGEDPGTVVYYKEGNHLQSILLLKVDLSASIQRLQQLAAAGIACLKTYMERFKMLEVTHFDSENAQHVELLSVLLHNLKRDMLALPMTDDSVLSQLETCFYNVLDSPIYRRIGFYSNKPASDFRASGLFGLVTLVYFSKFDGDFLMNRSYVEEIASQNDLLLYTLNTQKQAYRYPIAIAVINIAKFVMKQLTACDFHHSNLVRCLVNYYMKEMTIMQNKSGVYAEIVYKRLEEGYQMLFFCGEDSALFCYDANLQILADYAYAGRLDASTSAQQTRETQSERPCLGNQTAGAELKAETAYFKRKNGSYKLDSGAPRVNQSASVFHIINNITDVNFTAGEIAAMPLNSQKMQLSAVHPGLFGSVMMLICQLTTLLDQRLQSYKNEMIYMRFNEQMRTIEADLHRVLQMDDIGDLQDLILRMSE